MKVRTIRSTAAIPSYSCRDRCGAEDARPVPGKDLPSALLANVRSAAQYRSGECHIECLCRLKVCTQLEVTWFAYWEIARLGSLQDLVDHGSAAAEQHRQVRSIAQQASSVGNFAERRHNGSLVPQRKGPNFRRVAQRHRV